MIEKTKEMELPEEKKRYHKKINQKLVKIFALIVLGLGIFWLGYEKGSLKSNYAYSTIPLNNAVFQNKDLNSDPNIDFSLFWNTWDLLKKKYIDSGKLDARTLFYGAIKGMMAATGDPYTTFFDPEENKKFSEDISGNFEGIGAELGIKNGILTIVAPLDETPAQKAGLKSGDKIIKINGKMSSDMTIEEAVNNIRGQKGTTVNLTIFREGAQDTQEIVVKREVINVKSVTLQFKEGNIADIKISRFGDDTTQAFNNAIEKAKNQKARALIIDLRNNPGGYLESAVDIASKLLPKGQVVVIEENGDKKQQKMYSRGGDVASGMETIVLINEGSASASEILAGALKDDRPDNVTLVGKKSFGKGSVQEFISLPQGTAAKITVARWLTPNGTQINEQGIKPDKDVDISADDFNSNKDPQMDAAIEILKGKVNTPIL